MSIRSRLALAIAILSAVSLMACAGDGDPIERADYGDDWPLTVGEAKLYCDKESMVWVETGGNAYPLNGTAMTWLANLHPNKKVRNLEDIWRENPDIPGTRISIGGLINDGLSLCSN